MTSITLNKYSSFFSFLHFSPRVNSDPLANKIKLCTTKSFKVLITFLILSVKARPSPCPSNSSVGPLYFVNKEKGSAFQISFDPEFPIETLINQKEIYGFEQLPEFASEQSFKPYFQCVYASPNKKLLKLETFKTTNSDNTRMKKYVDKSSCDTPPMVIQIYLIALFSFDMVCICFLMMKKKQETLEETEPNIERNEPNTELLEI